MRLRWSLLVLLGGVVTDAFVSTRRDWTSHRIVRRHANAYDDFTTGSAVDKMPLCEENVEDCLDVFIDSDMGKTMFGEHPLPQSVGITGEIRFVCLDGPEVTLALEGKFWHRRETVLGRAAVWLNAMMPEITDVRVLDPEELEDEEAVLNELGGELYRVDKRAPDFNGDRATMEYQGIDPDQRGPFPAGTGGLRPGGSMMSPA